MPSSLLNKRSQGQSSGVIQQGGGRGKLDDWSTGSSHQKRPSRIREIWRRIFSLDKASLRTRSLRSTSSRKRHSAVKKREKKMKIENPSKISTAQTVFLLWFLSIETYVFKKERNCKDSVSSIVKFIEWTLLQCLSLAAYTLLLK